MENRFELAQKLTVDHKLIRKSQYRNKSGYNERVKIWEKTSLKTPMEVVLIGIRTLSNGTTDYDPECGYMYNGDEHFQALLVTDKLSRKPFYVTPTPLKDK